MNVWTGIIWLSRGNSVRLLQTLQWMIWNSHDLWGVAPCNLVVSYQCSKGTCCLHLQQVWLEVTSACVAEPGRALLVEELFFCWDGQPLQNEMISWQNHQFPDDKERDGCCWNIVLLGVWRPDTAASPRIIYWIQSLWKL